MTLEIIIKNYVFAFTLLTVLLITSCNSTYTDCENPDYSNCKTTIPENGTMKIEVTINAENPKVPIVIYSGNIENNIIQLNDTLTENSKNITLPVNNTYSITAKYKSNGKTIFAVDDDKIKATSNAVCDSTCWSVTNGSVNLKLKY
jgi:hypothetical protein